MPKGVHVAHVNIDGVIDSERSRQARGDKDDNFYLQPDHIAEAVWYLVNQHRSAWTHEIKMKNDEEKW